MACRLAVSEANPNETSFITTLGFFSFSTNLLDRHVLCPWQTLYQAETGLHKNRRNCHSLLVGCERSEPQQNQLLKNVGLLFVQLQPTGSSCVVSLAGTVPG